MIGGSARPDAGAGKARATLLLSSLVALAVSATACTSVPAPAVPADHLAQHRSHEGPEGFVATELGNDLYELTFSGRVFASRDEVEGWLLYRAALLAREHDRGWFALRHLPGEQGPAAHPARPAPTFGAAYAHWQPHWAWYSADLGWQPWHPEWGAPFWTQSEAGQRAERFEAHAMIELGSGSPPEDRLTAFDTGRVLSDLTPRYGASER